MLRRWTIQLSVLAGFVLGFAGLPGGGTGLWGPSPAEAAAVSKKKHRESKEQPPRKHHHKKHHHKKHHHKKHHHKKKKSGSSRVEGMSYRFVAIG